MIECKGLTLDNVSYRDAMAGHGHVTLTLPVPVRYRDHWIARIIFY